MAWSLLIANTELVAPEGALASVLTTADDAAGANVLLNFAYAVGGEVGEGNQVLLDRVAVALTDYMIRVAREKYIDVQSATIQEEAVTNVHW